MKTIDFDNIKVTYDEDLTGKEVTKCVEEEQAIWKAKGKQILSIDITLDGEEIEIKTVERSPIQRIRRITGYCANVNSFNAAKMAELKARKVHVQI